MMGPREELVSTGALGPAGVELLYVTVRKVVRIRNVPPPAGEARWTADALLEAAHQVFAERGPQRLLALAASSTDEESFRAQMWTLVVNDLISQGRRSERGKLAERLKNVLEGMGDIELRAGCFVLDTVYEPVGSGSSVGSGSEVRFDELVSVASGVAVQVPAWDLLSERSAPVADRESLEALVRAVLAKTPLGLRVGELVAVIAVRLGVHDAPELAEEQVLITAAGSSGGDPAQAALDGDEAERVLAGLTADEQRALPFLDASAADLGASLGMGKTKAWQVQRSAKLKVSQLVADSAGGARVLARAVELVQARAGAR